MTDVDVVHRLDAALHHIAASRTDLSAGGLAAYRESLNRRRRDEARALDTAGVAIEDVVAGPVPVRIYRGSTSLAPAVIYCHSGAFVLGNLDVDHRQCVELAGRGRCTVISLDYRLAPEHPFPAALDDAAAVLAWAADTALELDIDAARLAVAGSSAGGALAARLAQRAAAGHAPRIVFQLLHQPVLDDRPTPSTAEFDSAPGFDAAAVTLMWRHYLSGRTACVDAAPARSTDLAGLPDALITCSEVDPLRDEAVEYAARLTRAGVVTELHMFDGTCHGFDAFLPDWDTSQRLYALQGAALRRALHDRTSGSGFLTGDAAG